MALPEKSSIAKVFQPEFTFLARAILLYSEIGLYVVEIGAKGKP